MKPASIPALNASPAPTVSTTSTGKEGTSHLFVTPPREDALAAPRDDHKGGSFGQQAGGCFGGAEARHQPVEVGGADLDDVGHAEEAVEEGMVGGLIAHEAGPHIRVEGEEGAAFEPLDGGDDGMREWFRARG